MVEHQLKYLSENPFSQMPALRLYKKLRAYFLAIVIFLPVLVINLPQIMTLLVKPFSQRTYRQINRYFADRYWAYLVYMVETVNGIEVTFSGDELPVDDNALLIPNHQNIADIPILLSLAKRKQRLGDMKWFMKSIIKFIPGPGFGMLFLDGIFLKRNWLDDESMIKRTFAKIHRFNVPIWLVSFLEGTRITPEKLKASQAFAKSRGLRVPERVMVPRTKGFVATIHGLKSHLNAIYDITIAYPEGIPTLWQMIMGDVKKVAVHVRRTPIDALPESDKGLEAWVMDCFLGKEKLLNDFDQKGHF